jgi:lysine/ornithine N-monooxygenase
MAKKLTDEQKRRNRVIHNVTSKKNYLDKEDHRLIKDAFLEKFVLCFYRLRPSFHTLKGAIKKE